jgi:YVTN family beta-propeller protein
LSRPRWIAIIWCLLLVATAAVRADAAYAADRETKRQVFVTGAGSTRIVAIDAETDTIVKSYDVPGVPRRLLVAAALQRLVTATGKPGRVHILDARSGRLLQSLDLGFDVTAMQLAEDGETVAVGGPGHIALIDVRTAGIERTLPISATPSAVLFDKKGAFLLVGDAGRARVHRIALARTAASGVLDLTAGGANGKGIVHIARTPGGGTGMAIDGQGAVTMIDLKQWRVSATLALPGRQARIFPTVNSQYFLLPNLGTRTLSIISTWTRQESERLKLRGDVTTLNTLLADTLLFAFDPRTAAAQVFDLDRRRRLTDIVLPGKPGATVTGPDGLKIYVALGDRDAVAVIDVRSLTVTRTIGNIGFVPAGIVSGGGLSFCH